MTINAFIKQRIEGMRSGWRTLSTNKIVSLATRGAIVSSCIGIIAIIFAWNKLPPLVPLWYSKPWGTERLAASAWLFLLPASTLIITGINAYISSLFLTNEYLVFSQIMSLGSGVISILSLITVIKIIFLVI